MCGSSAAAAVSAADRTAVPCVSALQSSDLPSDRKLTLPQDPNGPLYHNGKYHLCAPFPTSP